jgi:hypothetical protein
MISMQALRILDAVHTIEEGPHHHLHLPRSSQKHQKQQQCMVLGEALDLTSLLSARAFRWELLAGASV